MESMLTNLVNFFVLILLFLYILNFLELLYFAFIKTDDKFQ